MTWQLWRSCCKSTTPSWRLPTRKRSARRSSGTRTAAKGEDVEAIKAALHELEQASHALSKTLYAKTEQAHAPW